MDDRIIFCAGNIHGHGEILLEAVKQRKASESNALSDNTEDNNETGSERN